MAAVDPRKMALQIAGLRANETHLPQDEQVFQDPYAEYFFPAEMRQMAKDLNWVRAEREKYEAVMPGVNGAIVARIRYMDECVCDAIKAGFTQLVIIGAGYDTRAYRIQGVKENMKVFEIDHPMTQEVKTDTIKQIFSVLPEHVSYLPVVFGKDRMDEALFKAGYDSTKKTFFILEGLLMYIAQPAVDALLTFICKASSSGSAFVADFFDTTVIDGTSPLKEAQTLKAFVENEGSALMFGISEKKAEAYFKDKGFAKATLRTTQWCKDKYFNGPSRDRVVSSMFNFIYAVV